MWIGVVRSSGLIERELMERYCRGAWRLTAHGVRVAKALWPLVKPVGKQQLVRDIAWRKDTQAYLALHPEIGGRNIRATAKALESMIRNQAILENL